MCLEKAGIKFSDALANHGILTRPVLPLAGKACEIEIVFECDLECVEKEVELVLSADGNVIESISLLVSPGKKISALFKTVFEKPAWHQLSAKISGGPSLTRSVPVVAHKLFFPWFGDFHDGRLMHCQYANMVLAQNFRRVTGETTKGKRWPEYALPEPESSEIAYWKRRGVMACAWKNGFSRHQCAYTRAEFVQYLKQDLAEYEFDGIMIDEVGGYEHSGLEERKNIQGLRDFCEESPDLFVALWICGALKYEQCNLLKRSNNKAGVDLLMAEVYFNYLIPEMKTLHPFEYLQNSITVARKQDALKNTVFTIGTHGNYDKYTVTPEELEAQVRYIRQHAPEMPGLGFYASHCKNPELVAVCDRLCGKYYVSPVLTLYSEMTYITECDKGVQISAEIFNVGGMDSGPVDVEFYDGDPAYGGKLFARERLPSIQAQRDEDYKCSIRLEKNFTSERSGAHEIFIQIAPELPGDTLLDHIVSKRIYIR